MNAAKNGHTMSSTPTQAKEPHLIRQLGLWSAVAVGVGSTIGSGIFKTPAAVAGYLPGPLPMLLIWVVGGLFALCGALTLAEVGGAFPYSGGLYVFIREAFGRMPAFLFGWAQLVLIRPAAVGAVAVVFGEYALRVFGRIPGNPEFDRDRTVLAVIAIFIVTLANVRGVKWGSGIQNLTTVCKIAGLLVLVGIAVAIGLPQTGGYFAGHDQFKGIPPSAFGLALVSVLWAYDGWADTSYVGGEILDPKRNVPKAILIGTCTVIAIYLLANVAYLCVFSTAQIQASSVVAADVMFKLGGQTGLVFISATVMLSTFGTMNGSMMTSPRIFYALAEDRLFFAPVAKVHARFHTPYVSVWIAGSLGIAYAIVAHLYRGSEAFSALTDAFVIAIVPFYGLSVASVFVFRRREKLRLAAANGDSLPDSLVDPATPGHLETHPHAYDPPVHTPLYPVVPVFFIASTIVLLANSLINKDSRVPTLVTLGIVLIGLPIYYAVFSRSTE